MFEKELQDLHYMQQIYALLFSVTNKVQAFGDEKLSGNLSSRQLMALISVAHLVPDNSSLNSIAAMLGTSKQNTNKLLSSLKEKGCIQSTQNTTDKRAISVSLTDTGMKMLEQGAKTNILMMAEMFRGFTSQDLNALYTQLKKLSCIDGQPYVGFEENAIAGEIGEKEQSLLQQFQQIREDKHD